MTKPTTETTTAAGEPRDADAIPTGQLLLVLLPGLAVVAGFGLWLWSRHGLVVWFDSAAAFLAGCLG